MKIPLEKIHEAPETVAVDIETTGLSWVREKMLLVGISGEGYSNYFNSFEYSDAALKEHLSKFLSTHKCIFHNAKFDLHFLSKYANIDDVQFSDTMLLSQIIDENSSHKLESLSKRYFGERACIHKNKVDDVLKEITRRRKTRRFSEVPNDLLGARAEEDAMNTYKLYNIFKPMLYSSELYQLEIKMLRCLLLVESNGVLIDIDYLKRLKDDYELQMHMFEKKYSMIENLNSPTQVADYVFNTLKIPVTVRTRTGKPSTAKEVLAQIDHPFIKELDEYRSLSHTHSTYITSFLEQVDDNGRLHCNFRQMGARTGRLSCVDPNLQQVPKGDTTIRKAFIGNISAFDYSQMEAILYILLSNEEELINAVGRGKDVYTMMASKLFAVSYENVSSDSRDLCKGVFLGLIYGMGNDKLIAMTQDLAAGKVRSAFKSLKKYRTFVERELEENGYVETLYGRRRHLSPDEAYKSVNAKIQGSAADIIKKAIIEFPRPILEKFRITVHDENVFDGLTQDEMVIVRDIMTEEFHPFLKVKVKTGNNWGDLQDYTFNS